jgi:hypothetical protein
MEDEEEHVKEVNSKREHISAYVLIAGLILEFVAAVLWFKGLETVVGMVAVAMIVGGVWGEVYFGKKASDAGDKQLAKYKVRAAELEKATTDAQLELFRLRMPRGIDMEKFNELIADVPPASVEVLFDANSPDASYLAGLIWSCLFNARWPMESGYGAAPLSAPPSNILPWSQLPWTQAVGASPWGVSVLIGGDIEEASKSKSRSGLFNALAKSIDGQVSSSFPAQGLALRKGVLRVVVGPKHP